MPPVGGRPPLAVGAHGSISFRVLGPGRVRAMAYVRDADGRRREVTARGTSRSDARAALLRKIADRTGVGSDLGGESLLADVAAAWIAEIERLVDDGQRAPNTARVYRSVLAGHILPAVGALRVRDATVPRLNAFIVALRERNRASVTKTCRTTLNGILGHAVRVGAIGTNPMRDVARIRGEQTRQPRALTEMERNRWLAAMEADVVAVRHDLPALTKLLLATGCRIGEALALPWDAVNFDDKTLAVDWTIVRVAGVGLVRTSTKTAAGRRTLPLPGWAVDLLRDRLDGGVDVGGPVFPSRQGGWLDPSNVSRSLREARERAGFGWVTSHAFRRTVASTLDDSGLTSRQIADQLGHANLRTLDAYLGRKMVSRAAAEALEVGWDH